MEITMKKKWTGERLETHIFSRDTIDHLHRYSIASNYIENKIVLDIASGEGYGTNLLSKKAKSVYGVDIDEITVSKAKQKYQADNLEYLVGSTDAIPLETNSVDVVISFETIEHHDKHNEMLTEIKRVLKPEGILIISTPDKYFYSDKRNFNNSFHIKELYKDEFINLISTFFNKTQILNQIYISGNSLIINDEEMKSLELVSGDFTQINTLEKEAFYLIAIASNVDFKLQNTSIFNGGSIVQKQISAEIKNSITFKIGKIILAPFRFFNRK